ncbi:HemY protein [Fontimonas thermophila]|uniref:HemY protein n=1 Tax=Fontimonas thermophila TaxID=1076937 RepID=A0A1I2JE17_9GAMM|nr:heme biosynthesis HemY N-terminal domain-containing protein [Fontimonas thermophila]SFF52804.1 HemY protein [Fontimonas thermophila]
MIRTLLLAILALAAGAAAAYYLHDETGYVLISVHGWIVETSVLGFVLGLTLVIGTLWVLLRLFVGGLRLPQRMRDVLARRRRERAQASFEAGLLHLLEGDWKRAEIELVRRAADHHAAHLNYLAAARAAQRLGAGDRRDHYLGLAARLAPEIERATLLTQAELQLERREFAAARETALRLRALDPRQPYAVELLAEALYELAEWESLRRLLLEDIARQALTEVRWRQMFERALIERLRVAEADARLDQLKALWDATPRECRTWPALRLQYARSLARLNAQAEAMALAADTLAREWDAGLATLYGELEAADALTQLATIEEWLTRYGERPELLVGAGRACLRNRLWGKARSYLEAVVRVAPSPAAYLELARVCEQTQNPEEAHQFYRRGLEIAAQG